MKRKLFLSLTGLLAGAGLAAAQETMPTSAAADLYMMPPQASPGPVLSQPVNLGACTNGNGVDYRVYGRLEYILWQMGSHFGQSGNELLPAIRTDMPFGFRTVSYDLTDPLNPMVRRDNTGAIIAKDIFGIAHLDPRLFTGSGTDALDHNGGRATLGMFLDNRGEWSAEVTYFQTERKGSAFIATAASTIDGITTGLSNVVFVPTAVGNPPVVVQTPIETPVSFRGDFAASIEGSGTSRLFGLEFNVNHRDFVVGRTTFSEVYGLRYLNLEHNQNLLQILSINDDRYIVRVDDPFAAGNPTPVKATTVLDGNYSSRNQFFGLQVGARIDSDWDRFFFNAVGKFGFGAMRQELITKEIVSTFNIDAAGGVTAGADIPFEVYPNPTDNHENKTRLAFILEGNMNAGYHITENISAYAGYNILVMTRVARPAGQGLPTNGAGTITISNATASGPALTHFSESRFYAQGLNAGLEFRF